MLDRIILYSIRNKLIIGFLTLALTLWGVYSLTQLPIDAVPDITNNQVQVITRSPALAAQEMERLITFPLEIALSTIPGRVEIRSISRFGLSVVTIVFEENIDVYWARQQVTERMKEAEAQIPKGAGTPELAPVTTGLGEIYQYVLRPKHGFENRYSAMELRSIQDWIVRRQLLGTKGVADVSSFGGYLKQYEIALDPDKLRALNISIDEVFTALERNNQNGGGAYIEKNPTAYVIRTEGMTISTDDIGKIVVKNRANNGLAGAVPILIRDVGQVQFGSAPRYGAMTFTNIHEKSTPNDRNSTMGNETGGEVVGAIVMMLKGENSSKVIADVKKRIEEIQATLPEGLVIEPFLDRTKLVNAAISTVAKNLAEGALIVVFVLVLFLGNFRAGLVVASVIPLAMLFAVAMMNAFGVSGNLMSLGAIDFGLIVDGAVIIVEAVLHHLALPLALPKNEEARESQHLSQAQMDDEVYHAASTIRSSAAFGEIIILIVYLPILALSGVEGKMFAPMAQTVVFAIAGAFLLSLTYVPMMTAFALSKNITHKETFSDRMMNRVQAFYTPLLSFVLRRKALILLASAAMLLISLIVFFRMGGEFIPTLDEGDFAVETRAMTGSALAHTVDISLKAAQILQTQFPEVKKVVGKVGTSEIPTDPMPLESCDLMIILKEKNEWTSANSRDELASKMQSALEAIPGVEFGFQQPIQMRFNELMTGARQDVVLKIFGENLDILAREAAKVGAVASKIQGAEDVYVEKVSGLPQIIVAVNRDELARFGVAVDDINRSVRAAFAGEKAGLMFENEQRYDLVVRLDTTHRRTIEDVRNLLITTPSGLHVPLTQLASVEMRLGPNQIQREDAKRRITVGFNVRNRDVESIVEELRNRIQQNITLPTGYYISYGGSFENLEQAKKRLLVAVPIALVLIFMLLYFTFGSLMQSALIFTAIPLAAIGGVFALALRGMPFSISAGVGFIALFGVAVLNGIVLIGHFNRLKREGMTDIEEIVTLGTAARLRPVLMTGAVASLGFLPMALSNSSGAEVQKPLATVVIGGLVSATLLTLLVLPILYILAERFSTKHPPKNPINTMNTSFLVLFVVIASLFISPQNSLLAQAEQTETVRTLSLEEAIRTSLQNNPNLSASRMETDVQRALKSTASDIGKTNTLLQLGQYNSFEQDNSINISQTIPFPTVFVSQANLADARIASAERTIAITRNELLRAVKSTFYHLAYLQAREQLLREQDSILTAFVRAATLRTQTGESSVLERSSAELQAAELRSMLQQTLADRNIASVRLRTLLAEPVTNSSTTKQSMRLINVVVPPKRVLALNDETDTLVLQRNPQLALVRQQIALADAEKAVETSRMLPDITLGWFSQTLIGASESGRIATANDRFTGFQIGMSIPLWISPYLARLEAASIRQRVAEMNMQAYRLQVSGDYGQAIEEYRKLRTVLEFYEQSALPQASLLLSTSQALYTRGDIGYVEYSQNVSRALSVRGNYVQRVAEYNQAVIALEYLLGE